MSDGSLGDGPMLPMVLLVLAALCALAAVVLSTAESAFMRLSRREAEEAAQKHGSSAVARILDDPVAHTVALQLWRWLGAAVAVLLVTLAAVRLTGGLLAGGLAAAGVLVLGGIGLATLSPRRVGRQHHLLVAAHTARLVRGLRTVLGPVPRLLIAGGTRLVPGTGGPDQGFFDDEELRDAVVRASEGDVIEDAEAELIQSVFDLSETRVRAVMVPRPDMVSVSATATLGEVMSIFLRSGCSRAPVIEGSADAVTGMIYLKDVAFLEHRLHAGEPPAAFAERDPAGIVAAEVQREARFVPESQRVSALLPELQRESTHVAVVADEYGGTAGLVTLEDLIEEIVGDIVDEYDVETADVEELGDGRRRLSARMSVDDFAALHGIDLDDEEDVDTVGGLLAKALGQVPIVGSEAEIRGVLVRADGLSGRRNRISHVLAARAPSGERRETMERPSDAGADADADGRSTDETRTDEQQEHQ